MGRKQFTIVYLGKAFDSKNRTTHLVSIGAMLLTVLGTAVAAVYIYYQMRLVIKRNAAMDLPTSMTDSSLPTWEDVQRESGTAMIELTDEKGGAHVRRPWLHSNGSYNNTPGSWTPARSKSLPGELTEEDMAQWVTEMRYNDNPMASGSIVAAYGAGGDVPPPFSYFSPAPSFNHLSVAGDSPAPTRPTPSRTNSRAALLASDSTSIVESSIHRDTVSLDLVREPQAEIRGGRGVAADADNLAVARGARRPGYGRSRGDSGAALLGRGDLDRDRASDDGL